MKNKDTTTKYKKRKTKTLQETWVGVIKRIIDIEGVDQAVEEYKRMCYHYATFPEWPEAAEEIQALLAERREWEQQQEQDLRKETAMLGAASCNLRIVGGLVSTGTMTDTKIIQPLKPYERYE